MAKVSKKLSFTPNQFEKSRTGIQGLDEITSGGLPKGRPTLICGSAGCGKTLFGIEFLIAGATLYDEPGVLMSFEENEHELTANVVSLDHDLKALIKQKKISIEYVHIERGEIQETGEYDLEGLFVRLGYAIDSIGAKRVVLDTIEALFAGLNDSALLRSEIRRLFRWLKDKGVTAIITGERGDGSLTRHGLEEYVSDCVILLDHRVNEQISTRRIRIVKYRGSVHGTNEYPFLIDKDGISVLPLASLGLQHPGTKDRVSTGIPELDTMLSGKGFTRGSSILISGTAGTGKTSIAAAFAVQMCKNNERCIYLSFEESPGQLAHNMRSIGNDLDPWIKKGLLHVSSTRPSFYGLEMHLLELHKMIEKYKPKAVIIDPITSLMGQGKNLEIQSMLTRMIDLLKSKQITALFTSLVSSNTEGLDNSQVGVSSLIDTWIVVRELEDHARKRTRGIYVVKSRGMSHSNDVQKMVLSDNGIHLTPVEAAYGEGGVLSSKPLMGKIKRSGRSR